jgi:probable rRNA maturation factor
LSGSLVIQNRQRAVPVDPRALRRLVRKLLADLSGEDGIELGVCLLSAPAIARLNETYLRHRGPTDVITLDYSAGPAERPGRGSQPGAGRRRPLHADMFVCPAEAVGQARRYRTTWQSELARYVIHGLLHLQGYDDRRPAARRAMKRAEDLWLRRLARRFPLRTLARKPRMTG